MNNSTKFNLFISKFFVCLSTINAYISLIVDKMSQDNKVSEIVNSVSSTARSISTNKSEKFDKLPYSDTKLLAPVSLTSETTYESSGVVELMPFDVGTFYKVVANGGFTFEMIDPSTPVDWSATYFQFSPEHALGYAQDKVPRNGGDTICLTAFRFAPDAKFRVVQLDSEKFSDSAIPDSEKAVLAKKLLGINFDFKLMQSLNGALIIRDNPEDWELVVSHERVAMPYMQYHNLLQLRIVNHHITHWRLFSIDSSSSWRQLTYAEQLAPHLLGRHLALVTVWP